MTRPNESCSLTRVREWLRLSCRFGDALLTGIRILAGPSDEVEIGARELEQGQSAVNKWGFRENRGLTVTLPVRPGHRRLIQIVGTEFEGRYTIAEGTAAILSAVWLPGEPGPTIVVD